MESVSSLTREAMSLHQRALAEAPYLRAHYRFAHVLNRIEGNLVAPELTPLRNASQSQ